MSGRGGRGCGRGTFIHRHAAVDTYLVVITDRKWPVSKLVFIVANEPKGNIALCLLARQLPAEVGLRGQPALNVLRRTADAVEGLLVSTITLRSGVVLIDPVGPEAAQLWGRKTRDWSPPASRELPGARRGQSPHDRPSYHGQRARL